MKSVTMPQTLKHSLVLTYKRGKAETIHNYDFTCYLMRVNFAVNSVMRNFIICIIHLAVLELLNQEG